LDCLAVGAAFCTMEQVVAQDASSQAPSAAPVLSTPAAHMFEEPVLAPDASVLQDVNDDEFYERYEILRTVQEIQQGGYKRIALQFPDGLLLHAVRVFQALQKELSVGAAKPEKTTKTQEDLETDLSNVSLQDSDSVKLYILADTSYSSCCADEIAAEHVAADVIVHYGLACLSPTARLPVIHVFTRLPVDMEAVVSSFLQAFPAPASQKVVIVADFPYQHHLSALSEQLTASGYNSQNIFVTSPLHDPNAPIPNRTAPPRLQSHDDNLLAGYSLFHLGVPPTVLPLVLSTRIISPQRLVIYDPLSPSANSSPLDTAHRIIRRRYGLLTRLRSSTVIGIITAAPSSKSLLPTVSLLSSRIRSAGKKSYLMSVGKLNPAKLANFSEIEIWVNVGCWESSFVPDAGSSEYLAPMVTAWEALMALDDDGMQKVWKGEWIGELDVETAGEEQATKSDDEDDEPEYDFRTGRLVTNSRPMKTPSQKKEIEYEDDSGAVIKRSDDTQLATIGGVVSPAAEFLREKRTWQGLGTDYEVDYTHVNEGAIVQEGRSGVARGYENEKRD
jgi:diphthamide biosynthesis protein 2